MTKESIGIIGFGFLGKAFTHGFSLHADIKIYDKYDNTYDSLEDTVNSSRFIMIGVPTPMRDDGSQDLSNMDDAVKSVIGVANEKKIIVLRSTIIPGTTKGYANKYPDHAFLFHPEFLTERSAKLDFINAARIIIGHQKDNDKAAKEFEALYRSRFPHTPIYLTTWEAAEVVKYMCNSFFAVKISFLNELYDVANRVGIPYDELRNMFLADARIGNSHTDVPGHDGSRGYGGKCLLPHSEIFTNEGVTMIKDIKVGDMVLTHKGRFKKVTAVYVREIDEDVVALKTQGLGTLTLTKEHPVLAAHTNRKIYGKKIKKLSNYNGKLDLKWINVADLKKGDYVVLPKIKNKNGTAFNKDLMRLYGYYLAEGSIHIDKDINRNRQKRISFSFNINERNYQNDVIDIVNKLFGLKAYTTDMTSSNCSNIRFSSDKIADQIEKNCGRYSHRKKVARDILFASNESLIELMKGWYYGDGSKSCGVYTMATVSKEFFNQLKFMLLRFGIAFTTTEYKAKTDKNGTKHKPSYFIKIRNYNEIEKFGTLVDDPVNKKLKLRRKTSWFENNFMYVPIKDIIYTNYSGEVYNLEVDEDNSYATTCCVVHNCFPKDVQAFIEWAGSEGLKLDMCEAADKVNTRIRTVKDWLDIKGATSKNNYK